MNGGSDEYNYALGLKRAKATKDALIADGVDSKRIVMVSFGESNPVCTQRNYCLLENEQEELITDYYHNLRVFFD